MGKLIPKDILLHNEAVVPTWGGTSQAALQEALLETALAQLADSGQHHRVDAMWSAGMALLLQSQVTAPHPWLASQPARPFCSHKGREP